MTSATVSLNSTKVKFRLAGGAQPLILLPVRVNDRGPFVAGRLLDLSEGAARAIGGIGAGLIHVRIRVVALPEGTDTAAGKPPPH